MHSCSIIIPALISNSRLFELTKTTLDGLFCDTDEIDKHEVILVDDGSNVKYTRLLKKKYDKLNIVSNETNKGFAYSANQGIRASNNEYILLLNNDILVRHRKWLNHLLESMKHYYLTAPKESLLDQEFNYIPDAQRHRYSKSRCFGYLVGWCLLVKREVFKEVGLFPLDFGSGFWEDTAWFYRVKTQFPKFKYGITYTNIQHLEHSTFRANNINLTQQYQYNRRIFLDYVAGRKELNFPKL